MSLEQAGVVAWGVTVAPAADLPLPFGRVLIFLADGLAVDDVDEKPDGDPGPTLGVERDGFGPK